MATLFESIQCSRCGGSGHYSYCTEYGTTCFKCGGSCRVHTVRGAMAYRRYQELLHAPAETVKIGDKVYIEPMPGGWRGGWLTIEAITEEPGERLRFQGQFHGGPHTLGMDKGYKVRLAQTKEAKAAALEAALAYQATLTKAGTPRKVKQAKQTT